MYMELKIEVDGNLSLLLINKTREIQKIWEFSNSWGWNSLHFEFRKVDSNDVLILKRKKSMIWSPNIPTYFTIAPHKSLKISFDIGDKTWEKNWDLTTIKNEVLLVKAFLIILETQESKEFNVFTGRLESNTIKLKPPHKWCLSND